MGGEKREEDEEEKGKTFSIIHCHAAYREM
jgi:hypothetical protein